MDASNLVILVVEDDEELNSLERELLRVNGMESVPAFSGTEALEACEKAPVDAVLLDLMLPHMDGYETCQRIRQRLGVHLPILMVTALDTEECRRRGFEVGADAYFTKPFDPDEIILTIRQLLRKANGHRRQGRSRGGDGDRPGV